MEEFRFPNNPSFLHMNSSNLELLNNMASIEGFNNHHQQTTIPISYDVDQTLGSFGPNVPPFGPSTSHFFPSGHGYIDMNMVNCDPSSSEVGFLASDKLDKSQSNGGKKRKRVNERESQKPKEVVHVRAKRGQATDSHSLAERVRREKINEKLRCLQDIVPGCYKTMGMAVMLEVIINYVRSLQNQIDFLSMKLSAASLYYDFNSSEAEAVEALQGTNGNEAGYGGAWPF